MKPKTSIGEWERDFDKEFVEESGIRGWKSKHIYRDGGEIHIKRVKHFIKSLIKEKLNKIRLENHSKINPYTDHDAGYDEAVDEVNKKIDKEL
jgi:hypothetical protein